MNVALQIGSNTFHMTVTDAAKVMELLGKGTSCEGYWISGADGEYLQGLRVTKAEMRIEQINAAPISTEAYEALRAKAKAEREAAEARRAETEA